MVPCEGEDLVHVVVVITVVHQRPADQTFLVLVVVVAEKVHNGVEGSATG